MISSLEIDSDRSDDPRVEIIDRCEISQRSSSQIETLLLSEVMSRVTVAGVSSLSSADSFSKCQQISYERSKASMTSRDCQLSFVRIDSKEETADMGAFYS